MKEANIISILYEGKKEVKKEVRASLRNVPSNIYCKREIHLLVQMIKLFYTDQIFRVYPLKYPRSRLCMLPSCPPEYLFVDENKESQTEINHLDQWRAEIILHTWENVLVSCLICLEKGRLRKIKSSPG